MSVACYTFWNTYVSFYLKKFSNMFHWSSIHVSLVTPHFELTVKTHFCGFDCIVHRLAILNWFSHFNGIFRSKWFIGSPTWRSWCFRWWSVKFRIIVRNGRFLKSKAKQTRIKLECNLWQNTLKVLNISSQHIDSKWLIQVFHT